MRPAVYIETSFISGCVTTRTDTVSAYRKAVGVEWWDTQRRYFDCYISPEVVAELSAPAFKRRGQALGLVADLPVLDITEEVIGFAEVLVREKVMPGPIAGDALHVAVATVARADYVLSWNVRHLANPSKTRHFETICLRVGLLPPKIVTPDILWEQVT